MSLVAVEVLRHLAQAPASADDLARFLIDDEAQIGSTDDDALHVSLITLLADLERLALVKRAS